MNDKIETKRNVGCADLRGNIQLVLMRTSPGDFISKICVVRLKTQLDRVQARIAQSAQTIVIQTDAAGDEVRVKVCLACCANQIGQVTPGEWFASRKTNLQYTKVSCFTNYAFPFVGGKFGCSVRCPQRIWFGGVSAGDSGLYSIGACYSNRIGTVRAMQRAPIRNLGEQSVWAGIGHTRYYFTLGYHNSASSALDASKAAEALPHSKTSP